MIIMTNILGSLWKKGIDSSLATSYRHGTMWERGELKVGRFTLSRRCGWKGILFTVILEMPGICFLREVRRQVSRRKTIVITRLVCVTRDEYARLRSR